MGNKDYRPARQSLTDRSPDHTVLGRAAGTLPAARRFVGYSFAARRSDPPAPGSGNFAVRQDPKGYRTSPA